MPAAESAFGLAALGWVASPVINDLVSKGISYLGSDMAEGLEDLETILLPQFQLTIRAARNSTDKDKLDILAKWLARLKNAYYDAEAILHELEYKRLKRKTKGDRKKLGVRISSHPIIKPLAKVASMIDKKASPVIKPLANFTPKVSQRVFLLSPQKKKLWNQLNKLKKIAAEAKMFRELLGIQPENKNDALAGNRTSDTSSHLDHMVFGREDVRDQIIKFLLDEQAASSSTRSYSVVAITGVGGAGKTTLAQYVYNDKEVEKHFGTRMWLCLSENKGVKERIREMIECASEKECPNLNNLNILQNKLIETLPESEDILLVLDDVWYDTETQEKQWDDLLTPFSSIQRKCKIIVTSRKTLLPNALEPRKLIELSDLAPDDFKSLFRYYAFAGLKITDPQLKNDLCDIGDQIATKMNKSPLAAKVIGNQLRKQPNKMFWRATQENVKLSSTTEVLLWSYEHLDVPLQQCFLSCSIFPRGVWFVAAECLVNYWVALDFIRSSHDNENVDSIGVEYFNMMIANSIFQRVDGKYFMHDLFRDLLERLSHGYCFRVTNFEKEIPSTTLCAFLRIDHENLENNQLSMRNSRNLRALLCLIECDTVDLNKVISIISTNFKNLRVLYVVWLRGYKILPSVVGDLRNLRYLNVMHTIIEELPDSVSLLYHLQYLGLPSTIKTLPKKLSDLTKLRRISMCRNNNFLNNLPPIPYLGKLTSLQNLSKFHVRKEEGYELQQLRSLREIAGSLRIVNLNNVRKKDEAVEARLFEKSKLKGLELVWDESSENDLDSKVIEALQPPSDLEDLLIDGYGGLRCPSWLLEGSFLKNITYLKFDNCSALADLPQNFHQLFPNLTELRVSTCPCLIFVCENELQLNDNEGTMREYSWLNDGMHNKLELKNVFHHEVQSFKQTDPEQNCGENFKIIERAAQDGVPEFRTDVWSAWWQCHQRRINFIFRFKIKANQLILPSKLHVFFLSFCSVSDGALSVCLRGMATLKELHLEGIMTITTLPSVEVLKNLRSLRVLMIKNCWCLRSLGGLHALPNLEKLILDTCCNLKMKSDHTELPLTLQSFIIDKCEVSQGLLLDNLQFLEHIEIKNSNSLMDLSFGHISVLYLINCPCLHHIHSLVPPSFIDTLSLVQLPNLDVKSVLKTWKGCRILYINSSAILNELQLHENFDSIQTLIIEWCDEDTISFEKSDHLRSIKTLAFCGCDL
ncbi:Rp1-like protein [Rhynchospora pubera]|uniref:Rp1-like protein n=1 Tax=Rhynchospora pubera TaxID=906938 RepID=A0AAV8DGJ8_9POAL|nr:Rp1-like protein [Rhynchospora pubera]